MATDRGSNMSDQDDRELLLGILALQTEMVSRDRLAAGMNQWAQQPAKPLSEILQQQGALDEQKKTLLETAVCKYLKEHGNVQSSVAALGAREAIGRLLEVDLDQSVRSSLRSLLGAASGGGGSREAGAADQAGFEAGRYRILREHAQGGLGKVFVARDEQLGREVALKEIQAELAHNADLRARFVMEAEITGGLEHPGIVPVYGLGYYADGRPFYAMRFVRGESLGEAIRRLHASDSRSPHERAFLLRQLLTRFVAVCNAVAYAHSRGVIHRDIKPDNILLGPYGETLLVDWGLAKLVVSDSGTLAAAQKAEQGREARECPEPLGVRVDVAATALGAMVGTPAYMSPEQAAGLVDQLGPATDIYSLGATLYVLLTGRIPFEESDNIRRDIVRGSFPQPRKVRAQVPAALEAICLKAMALEPAQRYASARDMADDLEAWLGDEPVRAWREPLAVRAGRWMRRHRTLLTASVATLLVALVSLAVGIVLLSASHDREVRAKMAAEKNRQEATENYRTALGLVHRFCVKVSQDPRLREHGLDALRRELLEEAMNVYGRFLQNKPDESILRAEWAYTHVRKAEIVSDIGSPREAISLLETAREVHETLLRDHPEEKEYHLKLVKIYLNLGVLYQVVGRLQNARAALQTAQRLADEMVRKYPGESSARVERGNIFANLARLALDEQRPDEAEASLQAALATYRELARESPDSSDYQLHLARTLNSLAILWNQTSRHEEALKAFEASQVILERLLRQSPEDPESQRELAASLTGLGNACRFVAARRHEAPAAYRRAIEVLQRLVETSFGVAQYRNDLATAHANLAALLAVEGKLVEAESQYEAARAIWQQLAHRHADVPDYRNALARCLANLAPIVGARRPTTEQAERLYDEVVRIRRELVSKHGEVVDYQIALGDAYSNLGGFLLAEDRLQEAHDALKQALAVYEPLASRLKTASSSVDVAVACAMLSSAASRLGRPKDALHWAAKSLDTLGADPAVLRDFPPARRALLKAQAAQAEALSASGRHSEALAAWDKLLQAEPSSQSGWLKLGRAEALARAGRHAAAVAEAKDLLELAAGWGPMLYRLAALHGSAANGAAKDASLSPAERDRLVAEYSTQAVGLLRQATSAGYFRLAGRQKQLAEDRAFETLRAREDFRKLIDPAEPATQQR